MNPWTKYASAYTKLSVRSRVAALVGSGSAGYLTLRIMSGNGAVDLLVAVVIVLAVGWLATVLLGAKENGDGGR